MFMKNNAQLTATTVKIEKSLYGDFKVLGIRSGLTLQDFVEKCVHLYVNDTSFRGLINVFNMPKLSTDDAPFRIDSTPTGSI